MNKSKYIGYAVSVAIIAVIAFTFDWKKVVGELADFNYWYLVPACAVYLTGYVFRALRWQVMLAPLKRVPFTSSFTVVVIGFMANNILPLRMGELVRAWALKKKEGVPASSVFATIVIERLYDGLTLVGLFALVLIFFKTDRTTKLWGLFAGIVFVVALAVLIYAVFREQSARRLIGRMMKLVPGKLRAKAEGLVDSFLSGLHFLSSGRRQAAVILYSIIVWGIEASVFWIIMKGFDLPLPAYAAVVALVIVNIAIMIPAMPGYIGTFDAAAVVALSPFGIGENAAMSFIIILHALQYVTVTGLGLLFMNASGWSLREMEGVEKE